MYIEVSFVLSFSSAERLNIEIDDETNTSKIVIFHFLEKHKKEKKIKKNNKKIQKIYRKNNENILNQMKN